MLRHDTHRGVSQVRSWRALQAGGTTHAKAQRFEWQKKGPCDWTILNGAMHEAEVGRARLPWASRPTRARDTGAHAEWSGEQDRHGEDITVFSSCPSCIM